MFNNNAPRGVTPPIDSFLFAVVDYGLPLCLLTFLLYKYKPYYVNPVLHISAYCGSYWLSLSNLFDTKNIAAFFILFAPIVPHLAFTIVPHLAFTLYAIIYARKFDTQKIPFTKRLGRYIASFFIGIGLFIVSFVIMFAIGYCIALMYYSNFSTPDYTQKDRYEAMKTMLFVISILFFITTLSLLSYILYKNHKSFFTKIFDRICAMIGKGKP